MITVKQIFQENWKVYLKRNTVTYCQKKEVEKMLNCHKHSCNSRICSSCGKRYTDQWSNKLTDYLLPIPHQHIVLTVPALITNTLKDWNNLKVLMESSNSFLRNI
jgi:hypothetical protein